MQMQSSLLSEKEQIEKQLESNGNNAAENDICDIYILKIKIALAPHLRILTIKMKSHPYHMFDLTALPFLA